MDLEQAQELSNKLRTMGEQLENGISQVIKEATEILTIEDIQLLAKAKGAVIIHKDLEVMEDDYQAMSEILQTADLVLLGTEDYNNYKEAYELMQSDQPAETSQEEEAQVEESEEAQEAEAELEVLEPAKPEPTKQDNRKEITKKHDNKQPAKGSTKNPPGKKTGGRR